MRVAIVGLGRIGATFPDSAGIPRSHLAAVMQTSGAEVVAFVDPDEQARRAAAKVLPGCPAYSSLGEVPAGGVDLVVDARPPGRRADLIRKAAKLGARGVILEKPVGETAADARAVVDVAKETGIVVRVNFHRRFDAGHEELRKQAGEAFAGAFGLYGKGLRNYGSHLIDLLLHWMGPLISVRALDTGGTGPSSDPSIAFDAEFEGRRFACIRTLPSATFDVFELTLFGARTRVDLSNGGATRRLSKAVPDLFYDGYTHLAEATRSESPVAGLRELYAAFVSGFASGHVIAGATPEDALHGMSVIHSIESSKASGGSWCSIEHHSGWSN